MSREACLDAAVAAVHRARRYTEDVQFSAEDATRSDLEFLCRVVEEVISAGCTTVNLPDTVGFSTPEEIGAFFRTVLARVSNARHAAFSTHCHDDLGLAVANTLAAVSAGATQVECTINGVGERAGNASLEEIVMATRVRADLLPFETRIETREIYPSSQLLTALTGESVQSNKAIVGRNAFAHEAGIHQDGMLKDRRTYEIMRPEEVGVPQATLVLGKHSGRHAVQRRCEQLGTSVDRHELDRIYKAVIELADREKVVSDNDLAAIVAARPLRRPARRPRALVPRLRHHAGRNRLRARSVGGQRRDQGSGISDPKNPGLAFANPGPSDLQIPDPGSTPPSRSSPDSSADPRRTHDAPRCDTRAAAAGPPSGPASGADATRGS